MIYSYQITKKTFCKYTLVTPNKEIYLSFPQLLELRQRINEKTSCSSLNQIINTHNFVLLFVADKQHMVYLDIPQLLKLKYEITLLFHTPSNMYV